MTIVIKEYEVNETNYTLSEVTLGSGGTKAYYIENQWFTNLSLTDCKTILDKEVQIGNSFKNYASSLFCDGSNFYILQGQWDAKYNYDASTIEQSSCKSLFLRSVELSDISVTKPTTPYLETKSGKFVQVKLGIKSSSFPITLDSSYSNSSSRILENTLIYNVDNVTAYNAYQSQGTDYPDSITYQALLDSSTVDNTGTDSNKVKAGGWQYYNGNFHTFDATNDALAYHVKSSIDQAKAGYSFMKLFFRGSSTVNLSLFEKSKVNYFISSVKDSFWSKQIPTIIDKTSTDYNSENPFNLADKDGIFLQNFNTNMHGKKLYIKDGLDTEYITVFQRLIDDNINDGDGSLFFLIDKNSTLTLDKIVDDTVFEDKELDMYYCSIPSNNQPPQLLQSDIPAVYIAKRNASVDTNNSGYSANLIYYNDYDTTSIVLYLPFQTKQTSFNKYQWYLFLETYNITTKLYKTFPTLTQNKINVFKFNFNSNNWNYGATQFDSNTINLPDGFGSNLLDNTYVKELGSPNNYTFSGQAQFESDYIPFVAKFNAGGNASDQLLNGECYILACYDKSLSDPSYLTTDASDTNTGKSVNLILNI